MPTEIRYIKLWLFLVMTAAAAGSASAKDIAATAEDIVKVFDKVLGSKTVKDKLAELIQLSATDSQQIIILKADIAHDIPEGNLPNTTSIVKKIGDVMVVVNTTIDSTQDGDGITIVFESEVQPPPNTKTCEEDGNCTEHHFCHHDTFLGLDLNYCKACSKNGAMCYADSHCCEKSVCRWGRCREDSESGQLGTICKRAKDCEDNGCCALVEGFDQPVCRPLAGEGQDCRRAVSKVATKAKAKSSSSSLSVLDKLLRGRFSQPDISYECPCVQGLKCVDYSQTFVGIFDLPKSLSSSSAGTCVPSWAQPDHPVSQTLDEIARLQARQISHVLGSASEDGKGQDSNKKGEVSKKGQGKG